MQSTYNKRYRERSPARRVRQSRPPVRSRVAAYDTRERDYHAQQAPRLRYQNSRRPQTALAEGRYRPRRDVTVQGKHQHRLVGATNDPRRKGSVKRTRVLRKKTVKQPKTKDDLDMELDKYMGNEAIKSRLDDQLANYFAEDGKETKA
ncbi:Fop carboxy-terminal duplication domain, putative [Babesia ovis]|uniref:Fop carboxy-terminal duplication domain, putative n=1 Tax=Babesia ovis TaxID=5869 RepID=A0A9W5TBT0_BABOV|nr:Fop carboxy-terminal duplication domain, putative [Babesia ovis]